MFEQNKKANAISFHYLHIIILHGITTRTPLLPQSVRHTLGSSSGLEPHGGTAGGGEPRTPAAPVPEGSPLA